MESFLRLTDILSLTAFEFENICRSNTSYAYLGNNKALCRVLGKYKIYVDTRDIGITPHLVMDGFWETWLTQCVSKIIKPGDICIDIGANYGYYSLLMSTLSGKNGRTIAVEPNPYVFGLLQSTASVHSSCIEPIQIALSDVSGHITLIIPDNFYGDASIVERKDKPRLARSRVDVKTQTLDELAEQLELPRIDLIKMDVEGAEPRVFSGMTETIAKNPGLRILVEYSPYLYPDAKQFTEFLFGHFDVCRIKDVDNMIPLEETDIPDLLAITDYTDLYLLKK
ncbi:MAG TPA: FkbM family methyltransferase [Chitinophagaceae bacterium]|nr:FkbM family methyltransferase [Chitinophagaceae bacterium]